MLCSSSAIFLASNFSPHEHVCREKGQSFLNQICADELRHIADQWHSLHRTATTCNALQPTRTRSMERIWFLNKRLNFTRSVATVSNDVFRWPGTSWQRDYIYFVTIWLLYLTYCTTWLWRFSYCTVLLLYLTCFTTWLLHLTCFIDWSQLAAALRLAWTRQHCAKVFQQNQFVLQCDVHYDGRVLA